MFYGGGSYYYLIVGLQIFCAIHSFRRGTQGKWLWIIIIVPVIGSIAYIYSEMIANRSYRGPKIDVGAVINPGGKIKKLEDELRFTDTFANRIKLADAYLADGQTEKAVEIYTGSLTGAFAENEHVMAQLMIAYYELGQYEEVIPLAKKLYKLPQFARSKAHLAYAMSLESLGRIDEAENEFKAMKGRYSYFEQRYQYGLFLIRNDRAEDASTIFSDMLNEEVHLSQMEKRANSKWFALAKTELKKISAQQKHA